MNTQPQNTHIDLTIPSSPHRRKPKSALRLVETRNLTREQWLAVRKRGIGSSDAAAACGLNPYQSPLELWMIKTGRDQSLPKTDPDDIDSPLYWGNILEPIVAESYSHKTGNKVRRTHAILQHPDADKTWMLANLDYVIVGNPDIHILECKTAGKFGARLWENGVPEYYQLQVQHQLAVTGKHAADICVLLNGQELQIHRIHRNEALITALIDKERLFWRFVEDDTPPPADGSASSAQSLLALFPKDSGSVLDLRGDEALSGDFAELLDIREKVTRLQSQEDKLKQRIQQVMGNASQAIFADGKVSWKCSKDTVVLDSKTLLAEQPHLLQTYGMTRAGSRRFLFSAT